MKVLAYIIIILTLISLVSASTTGKVAVSVFVKEKSPSEIQLCLPNQDQEKNTNSITQEKINSTLIKNLFFNPINKTK